MKQKTDNNIFFNILSKIIENSTSNIEKSFEEIVTDIVKTIGEVLDIDRIVIYNKLKTKKEKYGQFYRWDKGSGGTIPTAEFLKELPDIPPVARLLDAMKKNEFIATRLDKMQKDEVEIFNIFDIKSTAFVPIFTQGEFWGIISFQDHTTERNFEEYENLLRPVAYLFANAVIADSMRQSKNKTIKEFEKRNKLFNALNKIAITFISQNEESVESRIENGVRSICDAANLDRFSVFRNFAKGDDLYTGQVYRWDKMSGGATETDKELKNVPFSFNMNWAKLLENDNVINGPISTIPGGYMLKQFGIVSALFIPLFIKNAFWGFVLVEDRKNERYFEDYHVEMLRNAAFLTANIFISVEAENKLKETLNKIMSLSKAKDEFLSKISHEIRTPMNAIMGITEIQLQNEILPKDTIESFSLIYNSGDSLLRIINDLLDLSKIEANRLEIIPVKYEIVSLINDTVHLNMMRMESKPIEFKLIIDENLPEELFGDELRIKQILNNVLSNAFKYTDSGEIVMKVSWLNSSLVFTISDTGYGMTEEQIAKIFEEYSRFNLSGNKLIEGTGLGMAITQSLVNLMNGNISIKSTLGIGSTFTIYLPQKAIGSKTISKEIIENLQKFRITSSSQMKKNPIVCETMPYGKVLIVDDVESNLFVAKGIMQPYDLYLETAHSGFEAIEKIENGKIYDIIFMDHMMPKMNGIEATKILREKGYEHPIIALTANAIVGQAEKFLQNGFNDFISKPIDINRLNDVLNKFIRDKQTPEVINEARKRKHTFVQESTIQINNNLLKVFIQDAKEAKATMSDIFETIDKATSQELNLFSVKAHAMKSVLANIAEIKFSKKAQELENAGKESDKEFIKANTAEFLDVLNSIILKAEAKIKPEESLKKECNVKENTDYLKRELKKINEACEHYDKKLIKAIIAGLGKMSWSEKTEKVIRKISELILHGDFDLAGKAAKSFLNNLH